MMMINDADGSQMRSKKRIGDRPTDPTRHGTRRSLLQDRLFLTQKCDSGLKTFLRNCIFRCKNEIMASTASSKIDILRCKMLSYYFTANRSAKFELKLIFFSTYIHTLYWHRILQVPFRTSQVAIVHQHRLVYGLVL